jgi:predicted acylesterase/phospholipase RssA
MRPKKRAIALAGGGPAAGLHIGALAALEDAGIAFDVFSLSCIGAWVGIVFNTRKPPDRARQTFDFFATYCFRDDRSYEWFPANRGFATDIIALVDAWMKFPLSRQRDWSSLVVPEDIYESWRHSWELFAKPGGPSYQEFNYWFLNDVLAVHPVTRYLTALAYKSEINGLSRIYYKDNKILNEVFQDRALYQPGMPDVYHNAWRMPKGSEPGRMQIFHNKRKTSKDGKDRYLEISHKSLCACSALPFIEESVQIGKYDYSEGALVDTVNFANLLRDHDDLDEVWVNRIVDESQVRSARSLQGALANLPMQFAAEVGENDVKLFRQHLLNQTYMRPRVVEIPIRPDTKVNFDWSHANLEQGFDEGYAAVGSVLDFDSELRKDQTA